MRRRREHQSTDAGQGQRAPQERTRLATVRALEVAVAEKAVNFGPSLMRLLGFMKPERSRFAVVVLMGIASVAGTVVGPKILGKATDVIFTGIIGKNLPAGMTQQQVIDMLRASGQDQWPTCCRA